MELIAAIDAEESRAKANKWGVAAIPYQALATFYRKAKRFDEELHVLERFGSQGIARGRNQEKLLEKLEALRSKKRAG